MTISIILYICGDENAGAVHATAEQLARLKEIPECDIIETAAICADNCEAYRKQLERLGLTVIDAGGRDYLTIAQFKNAAISYTSGDYLIYIAPGETISEAVIRQLMTPQEKEPLTLAGLLEKGAGYLERIAIPRRFIEQHSGFNDRLGCGEDFELAARALAEEEKEKCTDNDMRIGLLMPDKPDAAVYQEHYLMYAYIFGKYAAQLKASGSFDRLLTQYIKEAASYGIGQYFNMQLEAMISKQQEYYIIDDATRPVVIYMGDPICIDVLKSFAYEFADSLKKCGVPVIIYNMEERGTTGLAQFMGNRYRAVVGFQTALFSVKLKDSQELVNNRIEAPKFNFLYDHPLYLYYHFTLPLDRYYVLTQDENYAEYINCYYPAIKESRHLPPAGIELPKEEQTAWNDRIYDVVFVASYHDYRERMVALERECKPEVKDIAYRLLDEMKNNPNLTGEAALANIINEYGLPDDAGSHAATDADGVGSFAVTLTDCMDVCRIVMFYYREKVIEAILDAGITLHVFGSSWNNCPLASRDNLVIHSDVSYREGIRIMGQAKLALNIMSWHKAGMTERIANTMLNHTVCLTDKTAYLEKHFIDGRDIVMYDLEKIDELPGMIKNLLADDSKLRAIAEAGYENASANHRWINRARDFVELLDGLE